jgi:hypothetical protein
VPHPEGVAANQVNPWPRRFRFFWLATLVWVAVLLGIQLGVEALQPPEYVHVTTTRVEHTFETLYTSPQFAIPRETGNVRVEMTAEGLPSHYDLHVKAVLVNLETQQRYAAPLHFMAGEMLLNGQGQPTAEWYLQDIPGGRYVLEYNCYTLLDQPFTARIGVVRDAPRWDNFVMLMLLWPVIALVMWIQKSSFEKKRWNDSDVPALRNPPNYESL